MTLSPRSAAVRVAAVALAAVLPVLLAPVADAGTGPDRQIPSARTTLQGPLTISAAASLTGALADLSAAFRRTNPGVRVRTNFGSTSALVAQIEAGAPADVFASADLASQDRLIQSGHVVAAPRIFARNTMQIAVKPGNPLGVRGVADLPGLGTVALCGRTVPCGAYAATLLARANVDLPEGKVTRGADAKATLGAVSAGDADAAIVYATDVRAAGRSVTGVAIPRGSNVVAAYGISVLRGSRNRAAAQAFVDFVLSSAGRRILASHGFLAP
jgi:molybdate transport system substrate-binding protein